MIFQYAAPAKAKKKRKTASDFIIDEAEVDDDVDEDEDAWDDADGDDLAANEAEEAGRTARDIEARMRRERDHGFGFDEGMDADEIEEYYRKKYNDEAATIARFGEGGEDMSDEITQQTLLPGVKDPNLWMVKCLLGQEKETVVQIMNKYIAYERKSDENLQIRSVVAPEHVKGYIYIEAFKQSHVKQVIEGISALRVGLYNQQASLIIIHKGLWLTLFFFRRFRWSPLKRWQTCSKW